MWSRPQGVFIVTPIVVQAAVDDAWQRDEEGKKAFAIELAAGYKPFDAALKVFPNEVGKALWASTNWINDPVVSNVKDTVNTHEKPLDKDQLAAKVLKFAEEKDFGGKFYLNEDKVRLAAFELYAKIQGYIGKTEINPTINNTTNNVMKIELVSPDEPEIKVVEHQDEAIPQLANIKLVG